MGWIIFGAGIAVGFVLCFCAFSVAETLKRAAPRPEEESHPAARDFASWSRSVARRMPLR